MKIWPWIRCQKGNSLFWFLENKTFDILPVTLAQRVAYFLAPQEVRVERFVTTEIKQKINKEKKTTISLNRVIRCLNRRA